MIVTRKLNNLPFGLLSAGSVVTIGSYDGIHVGHMRLLDRVIERAGSLGLPSVIMSFEPTPKEYFSAASPPARLMCFREKFDALSAYGIDLFFCPRFNEPMRDIKVDTFIRRVLLHGLNATELVVGDDFRFAKNRSGSIADIRRAGTAVGMDISQLQSVIVDDERVSSTAIRLALSNGDLDRAKRLLGKPYRMSGKVIQGKKLGRELGFPTANVNLNRKQSAVTGVFAARVHGANAHALNAVASVGTRPTFHETKPLLEAHVFDFDGDLYDKRIDVEFIQKLRDEVKFDSAADLVAQMHIDARDARSILAGA